MSSDEEDTSGDMSINTSTTERLIPEKTRKRSPSEREEESPPPPKPCCFQIRRFLSTVSVEPPTFLMMLSYSMSAVVSQNLYLDTICHAMSRDNAEIDCSNITSDPTDESDVQKEASVYMVYGNLIESCVSVFFALFVGPWSDRHGRKVPLLLPQVGYALSFMVLALLAYLHHVPTAYLLVASVPVAVSGGIICLVMAANSYISDVTTEAERTTRMAILQVSFYMGLPLGLFFGGILYETYGYVVVFSISAAINLVAAVYTVFVVRESVVIDNRHERGCCADLVDIRNIRDVFATTFKRREGSKRIWIVVLCLGIFLQVFPFIGDSKLVYLYTIKKLLWDTVTYTTFTTFASTVTIVGTVVGVPILSRWLRLPDPVLGFLSTSTKAASCIVMALSTTGWMLYLGSSLSVFSAICLIVLRSMISKIVDGNELGKVFSFVASLESTLPIVATPLYTAIYNYTLDIFPGTFLAVSAGVYAVVFFLFGYVYVSMKMQASPANTDPIV